MVGLRLDDFDGGFIVAPGIDSNSSIGIAHIWIESDIRRGLPGRKMATLTFPALGCIHIKSVEHDHPHFAVDWGQNGNVRFCFTTTNLEARHAYFRERNIQVTDVTQGSFDRSFDFFDPVGNRLTAIEPEPGTEALVAKAPDARFPFQAIPLWRRPTGSHRLVRDQSGRGSNGSARTEPPQPLSSLNEGAPVYLETVRMDRTKSAFTGKALLGNPEEGRLFETHKRLQEQGWKVTDFAGNPKFLVLFHTYDPYGNQINVWCYEDC